MDNIFGYKRKFYKIKRVTFKNISEYYAYIKMIENIKGSRGRGQFKKAVNNLCKLLIVDGYLKIWSYKQAKEILGKIGSLTNAEQIKNKIENPEERKHDLKYILGLKYKQAVELFKNSCDKVQQIYLNNLIEIKKFIDNIPESKDNINGYYRQLLFYCPYWKFEDFLDIGFLEYDEIIETYKSKEISDRIESAMIMRISTLMEDKKKSFEGMIKGLKADLKNCNTDKDKEKVSAEIRGRIGQLSGIISKLRVANGR